MTSAEKKAKLEAYDGVLADLNGQLVEVETQRLLLQSSIYAMTRRRAALQKTKVEQKTKVAT